jgi:predicted SprT family Zn-dependent metalloprotease
MGTDEEIMETVRHEVAHAIVGPGKGHDNEWKTAAWRIGANPQARVSKLSYSIPHKYEVKCGVCSRVLQKRHRGINPHRLSNHYCRRCGRERSLGRIYLTLA